MNSYCFMEAMRYVLLFFLPILTSCVVTGDSKLNVRIVDKNTHEPVTGVPVIAQYVTVAFGPMAVPRVVKRTSDANGSVTFERLADGYWDVIVQSRSGEQQDAFFFIWEGQLSVEARTTKDGGYLGGVTGNPYADPAAPVVFYARLVP
ncbi:hypothetical protein [Roseimicrobium sp. ORNL1]|uniref:hypothetical protein n=1 Tax=Roseimicrobium sp. ORNL1 TaxID=2711231 RepID=UPI0013E18818|nr:hypothetical protein [Roseimicrobium sp. ORNL1]QIF02671.1 hypothetical protein G5S37_14430 [Roseimicrobium sp. ORNL1]